MSETVNTIRRRRTPRVMAALVVLLAVAAYAAVQFLTGRIGTTCSVRAASAPRNDTATAFELTPEQAANAATISAVGLTKGMPERAVTIALATSLQESNLRNLPHGDRDSLGLFQQRPSAGWGTERQILDPVYAASQFYDRLAKVPGYARMPLTVAAQQVQHSGYPEAYAKHESDATLLAAAFTGQAAAVLTCPAPLGHTPGDPGKVRAALARSFGPKVLPAGASSADATTAADTRRPAAGRATAAPAGGPGAADGGDTQAASGTALAEAPGVPDALLSVPVDRLPGSDGGERGEMAGAGATRRGWELAQWAVAQASVLRIDRVVYDGQTWSADDATSGWRHVPPGAGASATSTADVEIHVAR